MTNYKNAWAIAPFFMFALHGGAVFETFNLFHLAYSFLFPRFEVVSISQEYRVAASALLSLVGAAIIVSMIVGTGINNLKSASFAWTVFAIIVSYVSYNMLPDQSSHVTDLAFMNIKTNSLGKFMFAFLLPYSVYYSTHQVAKRIIKTDYKSMELQLTEREELNKLKEREAELIKKEELLNRKKHQAQLSAIKGDIKDIFFIETPKKEQPPTLSEQTPQEQQQPTKKKAFFNDLNINSDLMNLNFEHQGEITATNGNAPVPKNGIGFQFGNAPVSFENAPVLMDTEIGTQSDKNTQNALVQTVFAHVGEVVPCENCGEKFIKKTLAHRFCKDACRLQNHKQKEGAEKI